MKCKGRRCQISIDERERNSEAATETYFYHGHGRERGKHLNFLGKS